jgi:deazaflavin-dependent oxidoreductase (nitroreductase family)
VDQNQSLCRRYVGLGAADILLAARKGTNSGRGAKSGQRRVNPVMYQKVDGGYAVFDSKAGAPVNPDWYHNLLAQPQVTAEIGTETVELVAHVADGDERERIWAAQKAAYPGFADYERKTTCQIQVIVLEPARL